MIRVAVVGHVEWVEFVRVQSLPPPGGLVEGAPVFEHAGGGAVVAAAVLAELGAEVDFLCALGDDERGRRALGELGERGITVHPAVRPHAPTRHVFTLLDDSNERTIVTVGERLAPAGVDPLPWEVLADADGVYLTAGDPEAQRRARRTRTLTVTPRAGAPAADLVVDALILSAGDADERGLAAAWHDHAALTVVTEGGEGGHWSGAAGSGRWRAAPLPGPARDSYGAGDAFAAGFTFGLARGSHPAAAAELGARCGARTMTRVGAP
ncbi:MAG: hypothetical protein JOZ07_15105 [Solirubrobacterales bacterium]|nr:hypothetical protein [Solirubrobacterales bacterium]